MRRLMRKRDLLQNIGSRRLMPEISTGHLLSSLK
jgi:hypothetical protein